MVKDKVTIRLISTKKTPDGAPEQETEHVTSFEGDQSRMEIDRRQTDAAITRTTDRVDPRRGREEEAAAVERLLPHFNRLHGTDVSAVVEDEDDRDADVVVLTMNGDRKLRFQLVRMKDPSFWRVPTRRGPS